MCWKDNIPLTNEWNLFKILFKCVKNDFNLLTTMCKIDWLFIEHAWSEWMKVLETTMKMLSIIEEEPEENLLSEDDDDDENESETE